MSSGHASHKGSSTKPNVNASDQINDPQDVPQDIQPEAGTYLTDLKKEGEENPAATERPDSSSQNVTEAPEEA